MIKDRRPVAKEKFLIIPIRLVCVSADEAGGWGNAGQVLVL
jgi:hypothetical protein